MLGFSLLPHSHSPHLDFIMCPPLEASFNFVFGLISLSHSKPLAGSIVCFSSSVRSWRVTHQPGEKNQIISIITESTPLPSSPPILSLPRGVLHVLQTWPPRGHLCFPRLAELALGISLVADNGQTHQLCGRGFCQCWELPELLLPPHPLCPLICSRSEPWPWSFYWNPWEIRWPPPSPLWYWVLCLHWCVSLSGCIFSQEVPHPPPNLWMFPNTTRSLNSSWNLWKSKHLAVIECCCHIFLNLRNSQKHFSDHVSQRDLSCLFLKPTLQASPQPWGTYWTPRVALLLQAHQAAAWWASDRSALAFLMCQWG